MASMIRTIERQYHKPRKKIFVINKKGNIYEYEKGVKKPTMWQRLMWWFK